MSIRERVKATWERWLEPTFLRTPEGQDDPASRSVGAIKTYRYLRLALIIVITVPLISIGIEWLNVERCLEESISAYYSTPVHAVFVGSLVAVGVALIAIEGATILEDACLNVAGMLAPVVAFVPTTGDSRCAQHAANAAGYLAEIVDPSSSPPTRNNVWSLVVGGAIVIAATLYISFKEEGRQRRQIQRWTLVAGAGLAIVSVGFFHSTVVAQRMHFSAAIAMFVAVGLAAIANAALASRVGQRRYGSMYRCVAAGMVGGAVGAVILVPAPHKVLGLEVVELMCFAAFWLVHSYERWDDGLGPREVPDPSKLFGATRPRTGGAVPGGSSGSGA